MKLVVPGDDRPRITLSEIRPSKKLYAYTTNQGAIYVLSRLGQKHVADDFGRYHYGFVNISSTTTNPVYCAFDAEQAVKKAMMKGMGIMEFSNLSELIEWKLDKNA